MDTTYSVQDQSFLNCLGRNGYPGPVSVILKLDDYEVPGWPKARPRAANVYLRFEDKTSLIEPVFPIMGD